MTIFVIQWRDGNPIQGNNHNNFSMALDQDNHRLFVGTKESPLANIHQQNM